jgi:hypothetical protein
MRDIPQDIRETIGRLAEGFPQERSSERAAFTRLAIAVTHRDPHFVRAVVKEACTVAKHGGYWEVAARGRCLLEEIDQALNRPLLTGFICYPVRYDECGNPVYDEDGA